MKSNIVLLDITDKKSKVYCTDGSIYTGRCVGDCLVSSNYDDCEDEEGVRYLTDDNVLMIFAEEDIERVEFID